MKIHFITAGGTIDKLYFDAESEYEIVRQRPASSMSAGFIHSHRPCSPCTTTSAGPWPRSNMCRQFLSVFPVFSVWAIRSCVLR